MKSTILLGIICLLCYYTDAISQEQQPISLGGYAAYNLNLQNVEFQSYPYEPSTNKQLSNYGFQVSHGLAIGARVDYSVSDVLKLNFRGGFAMQASDFLRYESLGMVGLPDGTSAGGLSLHRFSQTTKSITIEPGISARILESVPFFVSLGGKADLFLEKGYEYQEELISPSFGHFETGSRVRDVQKGIISNVHTPFFSIYAGLETQFNIMGIRILPYVRYYLPLTSILNDKSWQISTLQTGFTVML